MIITLSPLTYFLFISIPHPLQSQSTLYNHQSTQPPLPIPFLLVSGWLRAAQLLYMIFATVRKLKFSHIS